YLAWRGSGLTFASVASVFPLLGQACFSAWSLLASFPGSSSIPLIFCPFRSPSLCFCSLPRAQRPVLHDFRSSDQELTLQQPRCAIRGQGEQSAFGGFWQHDDTLAHLDSLLKGWRRGLRFKPPFGSHGAVRTRS